MNFGEALKKLLDGETMSRRGWNGKNQWIAWDGGSEDNGFTVPYLFFCDGKGGFVPWTASQTDILADDWTEYTVQL